MLPAIDQFASRHGAARFVLAPMSGITDGVFRLLMREMGAHIVISDLVSAEGLMRGGRKPVPCWRTRRLSALWASRSLGATPSPWSRPVA